MADEARQIQSSSYGTLERSLERTIEQASRCASTASLRALVHEARRLRSIVATWHAIAPPEATHEEMLFRVFQLSSAVSTAIESPRASLASIPEAELQQAPAESPSTATSTIRKVPGAEPRKLHVVPAAEPPRGAARPLVTPIPAPMTAPIDPLLAVACAPYSPQAAAFRAVRHRLVAAGDPKIVGVTSAEKGEGKTICAINLAVACLESVRGRVLLLECNLRAPRFASLLRFEPPASLVTQLAAHLDDPRSPWLVSEVLPRLDVMAVDPRGTHAPLLDPVAFAFGVELLADSGYDRVIIDAAPVLGGVEASVVADSVDGMLLVARTMHTKRGLLREAAARLAPTPVLGVVVIDG